MTILGQHSVQEVKELITAKDYEQDQIQSAYNVLLAKTGNTTELTAWKTEWDALKRRYEVARTLAMAKIAISDMNPLVRNSIVPAEPEWQNILHALTKVPGSYAKGDIQDLYNRIIAMGAKVDETNVPQPSSDDADLKAFKTLDSGIKAAEKKVENTATSPTVLIGGGVLLLGALAYLFRR